MDVSYTCPASDCDFSCHKKKSILSHSKTFHPQSVVLLCESCHHCSHKVSKFVRHIKKKHSSKDDVPKKIISVFAPYFLKKEKFSKIICPYQIICFECELEFLDVKTFNKHFHDHYLQLQVKMEKDGGGTETKCHDEADSSVMETSCDFDDSGFKQVPVTSGKVLDTNNEDLILNANTNSFQNEEEQKTSTEKKTTICPVCSKSVVQLKKHRQVHSRFKKYVCQFCDYRTKWRKDLQVHLIVHTKKKIHQCEFCLDKYFATVSDLNKHRKIHRDERSFECSFCTSSFKLKHHLERHIRIKHDVSQELEEGKWWM